MYDNYNPFVDCNEPEHLIELERFIFRYCYRTKVVEGLLTALKKKFQYMPIEIQQFNFMFLKKDQVLGKQTLWIATEPLILALTRDESRTLPARNLYDADDIVFTVESSGKQTGVFIRNYNKSNGHGSCQVIYSENP